MQCSACHREYQAGAQRCDNCGAALPRLQILARRDTAGLPAPTPPPAPPRRIVIHPPQRPSAWSAFMARLRRPAPPAPAPRRAPVLAPPQALIPVAPPPRRASPLAGEWEDHEFALTWRPGETGWVAEEAYPEPQARLYYWQNIQHVVMPQLQPLLDLGWQPLVELGPACVQLRRYRSHEGTNWVGVTLGVLATRGWLAPMIPFMGTEKFQMIGFRVPLRRPRVMSRGVI